MNLVPIKIYIKAQEYNASPKSFQFSEEISFQGRAKAFIGSSLVNSVSSLQLLKWIGNKDSKKNSWEIIYKASSDGFDTATFHTKCDYKGETVTVIQSKSGHIFGGYNPENWTISSTYTSNDKTFLFQLADDKGKNIIKVPTSTGKGSSTYGASGYGPTFGGGHDLYICQNSNSVTSSYSNLGHTYTHPTFAYGSIQAKNFLAGSYNFIVKEIEVFALKNK